MRRQPSPASATTIAAPARQQAYTAAVRSSPGGTSSATRWPGRTPARRAVRRPARRSRASSSANEDHAGAVAAQLGDRQTGSPPARASCHATGRSLAVGSELGAAGRAPTRADAGGVRAHPPPDVLGGLRRVLGHQVRRVRRTAGRRRAAAGAADRAGYGSEKTGSRGPQSSRAGTSASSASPSRRDPARRGSGELGSSGMSATKSPTACRRCERGVRCAEAPREPRPGAGPGQRGGGRGRRSACGRRPFSQQRGCGPAGSDRAGPCRRDGDTPVLVRINPAS